MYLHLAAILPVCETFNPFLKQTIAQPKDWKMCFSLASAVGNLGNYDLSSLCSRAEILWPAPLRAEGMSLMILVPCHASVTLTYEICDGPPCGPTVYGYTTFWRGDTGLSQTHDGGGLKVL